LGKEHLDERSTTYLKVVVEVTGELCGERRGG
jgi:hypothetical protein